MNEIAYLKKRLSNFEADAYSRHLLFNLMCLRDPGFRDMEYDLQWDKLNSVFNDYKNSGYDKDTQGEYDCIQEFLSDKYRSRSIRILMDNGTILTNPISDKPIEFDSVDDAVKYCIKTNIQLTSQIVVS